MRHSKVRDVAAEIGFVIALLLTAEVVVRMTGWHRLWVLIGVFLIGHAARAAARYRLARRSATAHSVR